MKETNNKNSHNQFMHPSLNCDTRYSNYWLNLHTVTGIVNYNTSGCCDDKITFISHLVLWPPLWYILNYNSSNPPFILTSNFPITFLYILRSCRMYHLIRGRANLDDCRTAKISRTKVEALCRHSFSLIKGVFSSDESS